MWKFEDFNSDITISEIKNFAEYQFCDMDDGDEPVYIDSEYLPEELQEYAVINPWVDDSGRFPLNDEEAEKLYTKAALENFINKTKQYLEKHRLVIKRA